MLFGNETVGKFFIQVWHKYAFQDINIKTSMLWFNGSPGILVFENDRPSTAMTLDISEGKIQRIYAIRNPDKLISFSRNQRTRLDQAI